MTFDCQKLKYKWDLQVVRRNPFAGNEVRSPKTDVKLGFQVVRRNLFARNEVRSPKTEVKLRFPPVPRNPFTRNEVRSAKTEVKFPPGPRNLPMLASLLRWICQPTEPATARGRTICRHLSHGKCGRGKTGTVRCRRSASQNAAETVTDMEADLKDSSEYPRSSVF